MYKDYGKDKTYMQRENSIKYEKKALRVLEFLKNNGYMNEV